MKTCCEFHRKEYLYLCKCKKLWADNQEWWDHAWNLHYGDKSGWIRVPSKFYTHGDNAQMVARKLLLQRVDIKA
jgi:hypothetical protein